MASARCSCRDKTLLECPGESISFSVFFVHDTFLVPRPPVNVITSFFCKVLFRAFFVCFCFALGNFHARGIFCFFGKCPGRGSPPFFVFVFLFSFADTLIDFVLRGQ
jgi:hypothetical protein